MTTINAPDPRRWYALAVLSLAQLVVIMGDSIPAVRKLLSSVVSELDRPVNAVDVVTAIDQCLPLPDLVPCLNPLCDNKCSWSKGAGRPREYCRRSCRQSALRTHARLTDEMMLIEQVLAQGACVTPTACG